MAPNEEKLETVVNDEGKEELEPSAFTEDEVTGSWTGLGTGGTDEGDFTDMPDLQTVRDSSDEDDDINLDCGSSHSDPDQSWHVGNQQRVELVLLDAPFNALSVQRYEDDFGDMPELVSVQGATLEEFRIRAWGQL
jgi:hypothetical protein